MSGLEYDGMVLNQPSNNVQNKRSFESRSERRFHWQSALLLEEVRRQTFSSWPVNYIDPDDLARAGFFFLRTQDHVQCVFCQGIVGYWDPGDVPEVEHRKHFPNCPFITGSTTGNVPKTTSDGNASALYEFLHKYHTFRVSSTKPQQINTSYQTDSIRVPESGQLAHPHMNTLVNRLQTYTRWPKDVGIEPDALAEAGFFSTGLSDWVQCFHCGGGLYGWRTGDNPLVDHARFFPSCPFARGKVGEDVINKSLRESPPPMSESRRIIVSDSEAELLLHHPMAKRLLGMGLSRVSVKEALRNRLQSRGILCRTVTEALELVFDYDEQQRRQSSNANGLCHDGLLIPAEIANGPLAVPQQVMMQTSNNFGPVPTIQNFPVIQPQSVYARLLKEVEDLQQQVMIEENRMQCRLCKQAKVAVVFQPCFHLHLCAECARPRDTCPTCGSIIRGTLRPIIG